MQNNNLTRYDEGGLHHQNPLGGVPIGGNNTVEEGETKMKNYVYSNRLSIDENMTKEMNLPSYIKGKTFASASKAIDNKFKDRNDNHSLETKKIFLDRLKEAQETLKQQEQQKAEQIAQSMQANQQEVPDMMNGQIPEGMEEYSQPQGKQFSDGGYDGFTDDGSAYSGGSNQMSGKNPMGYLGAAKGGLDVFNLANGQGASTNTAGTALNGAMTGAQAGSVFGPYGMAAGAVIGAGAGIIGSNKLKKAEIRQKGENALNYGNQFRQNEYAYGGNLNEEDPIKNNIFKPTTIEQIQNYQQFKGIAKPGDKGYGNFGPKTTAQFEIDKQNWTPENPIITPGGREYLTPVNQMKSQPTTYSNLPTAKIPTKEDLLKNTYNNDKPGSWAGRTQRNTREYLDKNGGKILKYAPVAMNAYQLATLKKPNNKILQRLGDRYVPKYADESTIQNIADQELNNNINAISQSGGSQGAVRNSILAAGLNKTKALSDAYIKINAANRATDDKAQQFNLDVNQFNAQTQHQESENWERNAAAYRNEKSKLLSAIGTDLGSIGKEEVNKNQIAEALGYDVDGDYVINKVTKERIHKDELAKRIAAKEKTTTNAYGGYLKMNKIGRK